MHLTYENKCCLTFKTLILISFLFQQFQGYGQDKYATEFTTVDGKKMAYKSYGLKTRKSNDPVLVFESGLGGGKVNFEVLFPLLSQGTAGIAYDRNGIKESQADTTIKNDVDVVTRLHELLVTLKVTPPYLLVGHSLGGPLIRLFTSIYPNEVCGLVFIDPTDFLLTKDEDEKVKKLTSSLTGYRDIHIINLKAILSDSTASLGTRNEAKRLLDYNYPFFFKEYASLPPLKNIPVTVLISYNKPVEFYETEMIEKFKLGINLVPWWKELDLLRIAHYADMIKNNQHSKILLLPGYSHGIHHQDPKLVADAISDVYKNCLDVNKK